MKPKNRRKKKKLAEDWDIDDDDIEGYREWDLQQKLDSDRYNSRLIKRFQNAEQFDLRFFQKFGFSVPLYFQNQSGLGIKMPPEGFSIDDVRQNVGTRRLVDVVDVRTQKALTMTMGDWAKYYNNPKKERLLNVISLEFSHTKLSSFIEAPTVVKQLDWVERVWPSYLKELQKDSSNDLSVMKYPKVRKYALMSVRGCYTDFHVDFGGTSVWYHIFRGAKIFWMVPPTEENLRIFEEWSLSGKQGEVFFPDLVTDCECIHLTQGTTFFIPPGWIHGVYTPEDSLVFGGNYLHTYGGRIQLRVWDLEESMHVKLKYRYPFFKRLHWYVLARYVLALLGKKYLVDKKGDMETEAFDFHSGPWIHITKYEVENLQTIVTWLRRLSQDQQEVPDDIMNPGSLMRDAQILVNLHNDDDFFGEALTGESVLELKKRKVVKKETKPTTKSTKPKTQMRKRIRCQRCEPCLRDNCQLCVFCRDMRKFGGPGLLRKSCVLKGCLAPQLPCTTACDLCGCTTPGLVECGICWAIVHPQCLYVRSCREGVDLRKIAGVSRPDLPNFWNCPLCVWEGRTAKPCPTRLAPTIKSLEREAEAMGMRHRSKRAASGDAFARLVAMTYPAVTTKRQRVDETLMDEPDSFVVPTVVLPSPERPEPKSEFQISTVNCLEDYVDHEEVIGGSDSPVPQSKQNDKRFVVPAPEEIFDCFEERFVARTSSRGEVERPKRFIEEG